MLHDTIHHKLLIGGEFLYADSIPVNDGCAWDGNSYTPMMLGNSNIRMSSTMWNGYNVFAVDLIVRLFDSTQSVAFNYPALSGSSIEDIINYNGELYIGGFFSTQNGTWGLAKWNGSDWQDVGGSINGPDSGYVQSLAIYNGDLIVAGTFNSIGGIAANHIARWDGSQWHAMGGGVSGGAINIQAMCVYNNELYVTGYFTSADGITCDGFATWNGSVWSVPSPYSFIHAYDLKVYHDKLYIAGIISFPPGCGFASFDGNNFQAFNGQLGGHIYAMDTFDNYLYLGGAFDTMGGVYCNRIARFSDDTLIDTTGISKNIDFTNEINIYPNPSSDKITIESTSTITEAELSDITGRVMLRQKENSSHHFSISIAQLQAGIYMLRIKTKDGVVVRKIVKGF